MQTLAGCGRRHQRRDYRPGVQRLAPGAGPDVGHRYAGVPDPEPGREGVGQSLQRAIEGDADPEEAQDRMLEGEGEVRAGIGDSIRQGPGRHRDQLQRPVVRGRPCQAVFRREESPVGVVNGRGRMDTGQDKMMSPSDG